jgi:uncharacterized protein (TIGR02996 family)
MNDGDSLLAVILANPDDDTPRLVYADWLQEHGDEDRAEFIRFQCGHAGHDEAAEERAFDLEERYRAKWLAGLPQFAEAHWEFRRGFPEYLAVRSELLSERYDAFARVPWVRTLSAYSLDDLRVREFVARPWNPRWVELELHERPGAGIAGAGENLAVSALARCPRLRQLRRLRLTFFELSAAAIRELADSPHLADLRCLELDCEARDGPHLAPLRERFDDRLVVVD